MWEKATNKQAVENGGITVMPPFSTAMAIFVAFVPTACDVGYKNIAVFDGLFGIGVIFGIKKFEKSIHKKSEALNLAFSKTIKAENFY